jgi:hypothetical protein
MILSIATLRWLIYEATAGETPPSEIKTQYEGDPLKNLEDI